MSLIDGKLLANALQTTLEKQVNKLKSQGIIPKLAIVAFQGSVAAWGSYVKAKVKFAEKIGATAEVIRLKTNNLEEFESTLKKLNNDPLYHGVIVQRPFPEGFQKDNIVNAVIASKDVDGFRLDSMFEPPLWLAVKHILKLVAKDENSSLENFFSNKRVVVLGKGETGGKPVSDGLKKLGVEPIVVDSKTPDSASITKNADIIICTVGRHVLEPKDIKKGVVLVGVGMRREEDGKFHGDYEPAEIAEIASYYTPIPGGVGPVNVAFLFYNLIEATKAA